MANPTSCYSCISFQFHRDGQHERLLRGVCPERHRILGLTGGECATAMNCALHIVDQVINPCHEAIRRECDQPSPETKPRIENSERQIV